jgi:hypothetical protein
MAEKIKFIRRNGRVIPIKDRSSPIKSGVAIGAAAGVVLAAPKRLTPKFAVKRDLAVWRKNTAAVLAKEIQVPRVSTRQILRSPSFRTNFAKQLSKRVIVGAAKAGVLNAVVLGGIGAVIGSQIRRRKK